ncbi:unnamed protein product [Linum tenue]|uniref:Uncharacterized protein n=1 Tax=Linum tenue TaxID=586396 RepID=A0AAV0R0C6_9ROSI|nr:unnamed protein product [Linum tenue]
MLMLWPLLH